MHFLILFLLLSADLFAGGKKREEQLTVGDWGDLACFAQLVAKKTQDREFLKPGTPLVKDGKGLEDDYKRQEFVYKKLKKGDEDTRIPEMFLLILLRSIRALGSYLYLESKKKHQVVQQPFRDYTESVCAGGDRRIVLNTNIVHWKMLDLLQKNNFFNIYNKQCRDLQMIHIGKIVPNPNETLCETFDKSFLLVDTQYQFLDERLLDRKTLEERSWVPLSFHTGIPRECLLDKREKCYVPGDGMLLEPVKQYFVLEQDKVDLSIPQSPNDHDQNVGWEFRLRSLQKGALERIEKGDIRYTVHLFAEDLKDFLEGAPAKTLKDMDNIFIPFPEDTEEKNLLRYLICAEGLKALKGEDSLLDREVVGTLAEKLLGIDIESQPQFAQTALQEEQKRLSSAIAPSLEEGGSRSC